MYNLKIV